jgi:preprotein translocase subunit SecG
MVLTTAHIIIAILLILVVLVQQGKGADMGATFGGGSNTLFGAAGADTLLLKVTTAIAALFVITSVSLAIRGNLAFQDDGELFKDVKQKQQAVKPLPEKAEEKPAEQPAVAPVAPAQPASAPSPQ